MSLWASVSPNTNRSLELLFFPLLCSSIWATGKASRVNNPPGTWIHKKAMKAGPQGDFLE